MSVSSRRRRSPPSSSSPVAPRGSSVAFVCLFLALVTDWETVDTEQRPTKHRPASPHRSTPFSLHGRLPEDRVRRPLLDRFFVATTLLACLFSRYVYRPLGIVGYLSGAESSLIYNCLPGTGAATLATNCWFPLRNCPQLPLTSPKHFMCT